MKRFFAVLVALATLALGATAEAKLSIVATTPNLASVAKEVAGDDADVTALALHTQDPHFVDAKPKMRVTREEIAGPVLTITPFKSEDEAVALANDTDYGFAVAVWTKDLARAQRVGRRLQAGVVWINGLGQSDPALPFGGTRLSGQGRSYGREALQQLTRTRSIYVSSK